MKMLSQKTLKKALKYEPHTGTFTWRTPRSKVQIGNIAGSLDKTRKGYRRIKLNGQAYSAHRMAFLYMTGAWPINQVDHLNHDMDDNRWTNLREATQEDNSLNRKIPRNNKTGIVGVRWNAQCNKYQALIRHRNILYHLGLFKHFKDAVTVRKAAERRLNFHPNHGKK